MTRQLTWANLDWRDEHGLGGIEYDTTNLIRGKGEKNWW